MKLKNQRPEPKGDFEPMKKRAVMIVATSDVLK
jgi:hypothetical protein